MVMWTDIPLESFSKYILEIPIALYCAARSALAGSLPPMQENDWPPSHSKAGLEKGADTLSPNIVASYSLKLCGPKNCVSRCFRFTR